METMTKSRRQVGAGMEGMKLRLEVGVAALTSSGQTQSGDRHLVKSFRNGMLVAVVDGLGHGAEAAEAAEAALAVLRKRPQDPVIALFRSCHEALRKTRGAVMTIASFNAYQETMTWLGVGNVESMLLRADQHANSASETPILRGGVVGSQLPLLRATIVPVMPRDVLIFTTDGVAGGFSKGLNLNQPAQKIADEVLAKHKKGTDDALVLVARYLGKQE
jgi:negative regulator of sigma-B (phosphoserine phosphatase)